ncbi:MAG: PAS domain S-box protein [Nannocystaceae bacterium]|nr:PAS domain S-box protein [Nannocystaceae bacterium]
MGKNGKPFKVVKFATDITAQRLKDADASGQLAAVSKAQAVIEFNLDGTIITANDNFLDVVGYALDEIRGKHHRIFVDPTFSRSAEYADFWKGLNAGEFDAGIYKRIGKSGEEVWIQATYNPILDLSGKPFKVVKFATDITAQRLKDADVAGQLAAVGKSQAVIEFNLDGTIITANENFLGVVGYSLAEIQGRHHRMFVESEYSASGEYREFWRRLNAGEFNAGTYKRIGKGGKEAWIQASYNPIFDLDGMPFKVVKFATDVTEKVVSEERFRADMNVLQEHMGRVAQGDLTAKILEPFEGEHSVLRDALNETLDALNETLLQVRQVAANVASGCQQVSESSGSLAQGATEQASALRQITATITLLTDQTKQNAEHARVASELSNDARGVAVNGDGMMKSMVTAMSGIDESSQSIRKIIKVIDEIAFQTNLLALNAAVEAARAGVHGKGFAVVAEEVRSLAARSAKAAKETTEMIEDSLKKVALGTDLANKTADALTKIVDGVGKVTDLVAEIAGASDEQARGISDVNDGVSQIDNVTQANTASAEESAAASQVLSEQASELNRRLERFQLAQLNSPDGLPANLPPELLAALHQMLEERGFASGAANGIGGAIANAAGSDFGNGSR